jgi:glucokinase
MRVLAGDIGGTSSRLACFEATPADLVTVAERWYPSQTYNSLAEIVAAFVGEHHLTVSCACFGIAGPVRSGRVMAPNLPWSVEAAQLATILRLPVVSLINDLEATAWGLPLLSDPDLLVLNPGVADPTGNLAVIAAGTGLGEALAVWDGTRHRPVAGEAGHADFAPRTELEAQLLLHLRDEFGRVSYERVVSGPGLHSIYRFLRDLRRLPEDPLVAAALRQGDPAEAISRAALAGQCALCGEALDLFVSLYGAEAGNMALRYLATGGVYVGGGIAPKIIDRLQGPAFMAAFTAKGRLSPLLESVPVRVIRNERTALLGAGLCAALAAGGG